MTIPPEYRVIRSLGLGATSEVFEAVKTDVLNPTAPGISVALKVFSPLVLSDSDAVQRLRGEVEALECLRHANIVALRSTVTRPDFFALELELIIGSDLRQWALGYDSALYEPKMWILAQVARGLGAAHENGVLHRDLKPENVLVGHDGCVKLTDFGLSRSISRLTLTRMGLLVGSLGYMAPECVNGLRATERSDLFSFGVIAYELLAGRAPFEAETPQALIKKITDGLFQPLKQACPSIPDAVADEIDRCLAVHPDQRPESSWSVEAALMNCLLASGLLPHCRQLVSVNLRETELPLALKAKHEKLTGRVQEILADHSALAPSASATERTEIRRRLLPALNELKRVFPDDPSIAASLEMMASPGGTTNSIRAARRPMMIAAAIGALLLFSLPFLQSYFSRTDSNLGIQRTKNFTTEAAVAPVPLLQESAPSVSSKAVSEKPKKSVEHKTLKAASAGLKKKENLPLLGSIVFEADPDVDIYVDGKLVSPSAWASYETAAGERKIRLVKAGFDPIDNTVNVVAGVQTVVRAKR